MFTQTCNLFFVTANENRIQRQSWLFSHKSMYSSPVIHNFMLRVKVDQHYHESQFKILGEAARGTNCKLKLHLILIFFLCLKPSDFSHFISQAHNFVAVEHTVTLTLTELFREGFSLPSSLRMRYQTSLVHKWKEIVFKKNGILAKPPLRLSSDLKPRKIKTFDLLSVENLNCKDQKFSARLHVGRLAQCSAP